jgi:hypothetical protein
VSEETRDPMTNAVARAEMEPEVKKRQTGEALVMVGMLLLTFCLVSILFVPSDMRAGHEFWTVLFGIDVLVSATLITVGTIQKGKARRRLNV